MDKLTFYRQLITQLLTDHANLINRLSNSGLETHTIFDETRDRYMLFRTGWSGKEHGHTAVVYIRLHGGKIWIEEDGTEDGVATSLLQAGVPREDIVLGFRPPEMRPYTEFAVA